MNSYDGPATLVLDGRDVAGTACIGTNHGSPLREWSGEFHAPGGDLWDAFGETATLRLPDGSEGTVILESVGSLDNGVDLATLKGSGKPPFAKPS